MLLWRAPKNISTPGQDLVASEMAAAYGARHVGAVNPIYDTAAVDPLLAK